MSIQNDIKNFIIENFLFNNNQHKLNNEDSFLENGILDSTGVLELVAFVEENYDIKIQDEELIPENLDSISNLMNYVQRKQAVL